MKMSATHPLSVSQHETCCPQIERAIPTKRVAYGREVHLLTFFSASATNASWHSVLTAWRMWREKSLVLVSCTVLIGHLLCSANAVRITVIFVGWEWESDWRVCSVNNSTELLPYETGSSSLGWRYAMDFTGPAGYSTSKCGSSVQKSVHFVRRRLIMRPMKYKGSNH